MASYHVNTSYEMDLPDDLYVEVPLRVEGECFRGTLDSMAGPGDPPMAEIGDVFAIQADGSRAPVSLIDRAWNEAFVDSIDTALLEAAQAAEDSWADEESDRRRDDRLTDG